MMPLLEILVCNRYIWRLSEYKLSLQFREHSNGSLFGPAGSLWMHEPTEGTAAVITGNNRPQNMPA